MKEGVNINRDSFKYKSWACTLLGISNLRVYEKIVNLGEI
jgi:hypothetical protein